MPMSMSSEMRRKGFTSMDFAKSRTMMGGFTMIVLRFAPSAAGAAASFGAVGGTAGAGARRAIGGTSGAGLRDGTGGTTGAGARLIGGTA